MQTLRTRTLEMMLPNVQEATLSYRVAGDEKNPAVLCIHGLTRNGRDFDRLALALAEAGFFVLSPDMPGRGGSSNLPVELYHHGTHIFCIQALLAHHHITHVHWVGTSMGGLIAMLINALNPALIKSLVMNDVGMRMPRGALQQIVDYAGAPVISASFEEAFARLQKAYSGFGIEGEDQWAEFAEHSLYEGADGQWHFSYDAGVVQPLAQWLLQTEDAFFDLTLAWQQLTVPQLLLRGERSDVLTEQDAQWMESQGKPMDRLTFSGCGHAPALMSIEQITPVVAWLKKQQALLQ